MSTLRTALAVLVLALSPLACTGSRDDSCTNDLDCPKGSCRDGTCTDSCTDSKDCPAGYVCDPDSGACVEDTSGTSGSPGAACTDNGDCTAGTDPQCVPSTQGWPGGTCVSSCSDAAGGAAACPNNAVCVDVGEDADSSWCLRRCAGNSDCRPEYYCQAEGDAGFCMARCDKSSKACAAGYVCDSDSGACVAETGTPSSPGDACSANAPCTAGIDPQCLPSMKGWPGGMCVSSCSDAAGGAAACPDDSVCVMNVGENFNARWCVRRCADNSDCRPEYYCQAEGDAGFCMARCNESSKGCPAGYVCDSDSSKCVENTDGATPVDTIDFGTVIVPLYGEFGSFQFDIAADVASFTIAVTSGGGGLSIPYRIVAPSGREVFSVERMDSSEIKIASSGASFAVLYPNSPRLAVERGRWRFTLYNEGGVGSTVRVRVLRKRGTGEISAGTIDVNAFIVTDVFGADAGTDTRFQTMIQSFRSIWASAGLSVGAVNVVPVTGTQRSNWSTIDTTDGPNSEFRQMIESLSASAPAPGLNFFFVDAIETGSEGYVLLGMAGGIPGIPLIPGTDTSGVVVSTILMDPSFGTGGPASVGATMAHEAGHWLGLYHTTESTGTDHDFLDDTVECPASRDTDRSGTVDPWECSNRGAQYLMFWSSEGTEITPDQANVVLRNPEVR